MLVIKIPVARSLFCITLHINLIRIHLHMFFDNFITSPNSLYFFFALTFFFFGIRHKIKYGGCSAGGRRCLPQGLHLISFQGI